MRRIAIGFLPAAALGLCFVTGCPQSVNIELTSEQRLAIKKALQTTRGLSQTLVVVQSAGGAEDQSGDSSAAQSNNSDCPELTVQVSGEGVSVALDFGNGCDLPFTSITCSGSAEGNVDNNHLTLSFDAVSCEGVSLDGNCDGTVVVNDDTVAISVSVNVVLSISGSDFDIDGDCDATHVRSTGRTTIHSFSAPIVTNEVEITAFIIEEIKVVGVANANFIPNDGKCTVRGPSIGDIEVDFDDASPATGNVTVIVNGDVNAPITVNVNQL